MSVTRDEIDAICAALPGTRLGVPPAELRAWKVGDKMFATFGDFGEDQGFSVKCPDVETAGMLIDAGAPEPAPYFHRSWVRLSFEGSELDEVRHRVTVSYDTIRAGLPKKAQAALPPREEIA